MSDHKISDRSQVIGLNDDRLTSTWINWSKKAEVVLTLRLHSGPLLDD
jgi:hypothetical protein